MQESGGLPLPAIKSGLPDYIWTDGFRLVLPAPPSWSLGAKNGSEIPIL